jgi:hypothetical protein
MKTTFHSTMLPQPPQRLLQRPLLRKNHLPWQERQSQAIQKRN